MKKVKYIRLYKKWYLIWLSNAPLWSEVRKIDDLQKFIDSFIHAKAFSKK